jgi:hypothetical protein
MTINPPDEWREWTNTVHVYNEPVPEESPNPQQNPENNAKPIAIAITTFQWRAIFMETFFYATTAFVAFWVIEKFLGFLLTAAIVLMSVALAAAFLVYCHRSGPLIVRAVRLSQLSQTVNLRRDWDESIHLLYQVAAQFVFLCELAIALAIALSLTILL